MFEFHIVVIKGQPNMRNLLILDMFTMCRNEKHNQS